MKIWVDADACPGAIKEIIIKASYNRCIETIFVSNKILNIQNSTYLSTVKVSMGSDVADAYIEEHVNDKDIVITQDIPLAGALVPKGAIVISFHGDLFTPTNIRERVSLRDFMHELRGNGVETGGPKAYSDKHKQKFANTFDQQLVKRLKQIKSNNI